ncbi:MAG: DUF5685 family protein [Lachnospiraceae bacterium]
MTGYIIINRKSLSKEDYECYRSFYCGLCGQLQSRYGRAGQMTLNYDMTFIALLLTALYEPEIRSEVRRCAVHPMNSRQHRTSDATVYAADMNILLSYDKCMDDWKDEKSTVRYREAQALEKFLPEIRDRYPEKVKTIQDALEKLYKAEDAGETDIDRTAGLYGQVFAEVIAWKHDEWEALLRDLGMCLGKFVYLADALEDRTEDEKKGRFNILSAVRKSVKTDEEYENLVFAILNGVMGDAARLFNLLPIVDYVPILKNILYAGVWIRPNNYRAKLHRKEQK